MSTSVHFKLMGLLLAVIFFTITSCSSKENTPSVADQPKTPQASDLLKEAKLMYSQGQFTRTVELCSEAGAIDANEPEVYYCLGNSYGRLGRPKKAIENFKKFLTLSPSSAEAYYNIGTAYAMLKEFDNALHNFNKAVELDGNFTQAYFGIGLTYAKKGEKDKAMREYEKLKEIDSYLAEQLKKYI